MTKELHSIKKFRGTTLGVIRLNNFIIWNKYLLYSGGKIYLIDSMKQVNDWDSVILCNFL